MKAVLLMVGLGLSVSAFAQSDLTPVCPSNLTAGTAFTCAINLSGTSQAGTQFTIVPFSAATQWSYGPGSSATAAGKTVVCNTNGAGSCNSNTVVVYGINNTVMAAGTIANLTMTLPAGNYTLALSGAAGSDNLGGAITTTVNPPITISVLPAVVNSKCDLNGDGVVNSADAVIEAGWVLGAAVPTGKTCDRNGDGVCNIQDIQIVANAAAGLTCTAVQ